ncbi:hypothetical protein [Actinomadura atramentaria]|nr:hypothetical protein [Actinomadura atramentaria]
MSRRIDNHSKRCGNCGARDVDGVVLWLDDGGIWMDCGVCGDCGYLF